MPQYTYTATDSGGKRFTGTLEAASRGVLSARLREKNLFVLEAVDLAEVQARKNIGEKKKIKLKPLAVFSRQFATLINAGITAVKAMDILYQQADDKLLKASIGEIYENVQKGELLSDAFRKQGEAFPELFVNMVMAGESAGNLDQNLMRMAEHFEKDNKIRNKVKGAMIYPLVLMVLTVLVVILMLTFVLPRFMGIIAAGGGDLPAPTRFLLGLSGALTSYWYLFIAVGILVWVGWRAFTRSDAGRLWWDSTKLRVPIVKKSLNMIYSARFARTLATLLASGIQMLPALDITTRVVQNQLIASKLTAVAEDIRKGLPLSKSLAKTGVFPPMIYNMISVGEESGMLDDILNKTANFYDEESEAAIQRLVGLLEPLMIVLMALIIGFIVVSIALPMFSMYNYVS